MPLAFACAGEALSVIRIASSDAKLKKHLEDIGIVAGAKLIPLSQSDGNMIVRIRDSRIAINMGVAKNIIVGRG